MFPMETGEPNSEQHVDQPPTPTILRIIKHYRIPFGRSGTWLMAACPMHYDRWLNLRWKEGRETACCFVCGWKPDAVELVEQIEHCDREAALVRCAALLPGAR